MNRRDTVEEIFLDAVELPDDQLGPFLEQRCGSDPQLRDEVLKLIAADRDAGAGEFLESKLFAGDAPSPQVTASSATQPPIRSPSESGDDADSESRERFRILRAYRQGGLGEVLLAHDRQLDRDVAIKQIRPRWQDSLEARQRFVQEARVTGRLEHPGIVPVYAMGIWPDGQHYYAMRFIEGDTLKDAIEHYHGTGSHHQGGEASSETTESKRLELRELLGRFVDVCNTIHYAHSKRVLHRDIKPSNIMVGPYGETLVVDWGLAKLLDESAEESMTADLARALGTSSGSTATRVRGAVGTPQYMSPEQARGELNEISIRTDVYLLGATLYQILTGRPPHQDDSISKLLKRIGDGKLDRPRHLRAETPAPLESICLKAMSTDPAERYALASEMADDVNRWMADQRVSAHHDPVHVSVGRWMRRHRTATSTAAVSLVLLAIGGVLSSFLWNIAHVRKLQADEERRVKKLQLDIKDQQRIAEISASAGAAILLAEKEITRDRYSSAYDILANSLPAVETEASLGDLRNQIEQRSQRISALVEFYRLSDIVEQQNTLSRDTRALLATTAAFKKLGIWDRPDWWTALPDDELSPTQRDRLRWDVYQQLMLTNSMLIKTSMVRLAGKSGDRRLSSLARNRALTSLGEAEARASLIISDRIDRFRLAESTRYYRSIARWHTENTPRLMANDLDLPTNAPDAHSMAVLCMIIALDSQATRFFGQYLTDDPLVDARNLFARSASLRPWYYGSHLGLGQVEYFLTRRDKTSTWEDLEGSLHAFGQCITLLPDRCFAYADRSSIYRAQAKLFRNDQRLTPQQRADFAKKHLLWALQDAERASDFEDNHPWIGWQVGLARFAVGQQEQAVEKWIATAIATLPLTTTFDAAFVESDDFRGRSEIGDLLQERLTHPGDLSEPPDLRAREWVALAGIRLNQGRHDEAQRASEQALKLFPGEIDALAMLGMAQLRQGKVNAATSNFQAAAQTDNHPLASFGLARCLESSEHYEQARKFYRLSETLSIENENRSAARLGSCRCAALAGNPEIAVQDFKRAVELEPATDVFRFAASLASEVVRWRKNGVAPERIETLRNFIAGLAELPRPTDVRSMPQDDDSVTTEASLLNGDFELGSLRYWNTDRGVHWEATRGSEATVSVDDSVARSGQHSLRIQIPDSPTTEDTRVETGQQFSAIAGRTYQLECWIRTEDLKDGTVQIRGPEDQLIIEVHPGNQNWQRATGTFNVPDPGRDALPGRGRMVATGIRIVSTATGTTWLDDVACRTVVKRQPARSTGGGDGEIAGEKNF